MKILHIIGSMDPKSGGPCQGIRNSNTEMAKLGTTREVVSLDPPDAAFLGMDDFPVHPLGPTTGVWQYTPKLKPWLLTNLSRFDVVIINGIWIFSSYMAWKTLGILKKQNLRRPNKVKIPQLFIMPHGMLDPYFQHAKGRRLKAIRNWFYWHIIEHSVINDADGILFTCEMELQLARKAFSDYHPQKEVNVGYGIVAPPAYNTGMYDAFIEKCKGLEAKQHYLLFFSRIHEKKGVDLLIKAYAAIAQEAQTNGKEIPKLVIAGPGLDTPYGKRMIRLAASYPEIQNSVYFPGMLTGDAKWGAFYSCDAFVLSSHQENFGIAVVEAMACQKPVLISNQINICIEIKDSNAGIVVANTFDCTKKMIQQWLNLSFDERKKMGQNSLELFKRSFNIQASSVSFLNAIKA